MLLAPGATSCCPFGSEIAPLPLCRLSWNLLGDEVAAELAQVLPQMGQLKRVEYDTLGWGNAEGTLLLNKPRGYWATLASQESVQCPGALWLVPSPCQS